METNRQVTIRAAGPADAAALATLRFALRSGVELVWEPEAEFVPRCTRWMTQRLMPGGWWRCWVAVDGAEIVGSVWLQLIEKIPNPGEDPELHGYVSNLYVSPTYRGAGAGSRLLEACLAVCAEDVVDKMILWPTPESRSLYTRHGFSTRDDLFVRRAARGDLYIEQ
jgi:ribosomal protein S18 acetylase RimI-like enzyme